MKEKEHFASYCKLLHTGQGAESLPHLHPQQAKGGDADGVTNPADERRGEKHGKGLECLLVPSLHAVELDGLCVLARGVHGGKFHAVLGSRLANFERKRDDSEGRAHHVEEGDEAESLGKSRGQVTGSPQRGGHRRVGARQIFSAV